MDAHNAQVIANIRLQARKMDARAKVAMEYVMLQLQKPVKAECPDVTIVVGQGRAVLVPDGQHHIRGEKAHFIHKAVVEAIGVGISAHQVVEHIFNGIAVFSVLTDAPAQLHAVIGLHDAALVCLLLKGSAHVPVL